MCVRVCDSCRHFILPRAIKKGLLPCRPLDSNWFRQRLLDAYLISNLIAIGCHCVANSQQEQHSKTSAWLTVIARVAAYSYIYAPIYVYYIWEWEGRENMSNELELNKNFFLFFLGVCRRIWRAFNELHGYGKANLDGCGTYSRVSCGCQWLGML